MPRSAGSPLALSARASQLLVLLGAPLVLQHGRMIVQSNKQSTCQNSNPVSQISFGCICLTKFTLHRLCGGEFAARAGPSCYRLRNLTAMLPKTNFSISDTVLPCSPLLYPLPFCCLFSEDLWNIDLFSGQGAIHTAFSAVLTEKGWKCGFWEQMQLGGISRWNLTSLSFYSVKRGQAQMLVAKIKTTWSRTMLSLQCLATN